MIGRGLEPLAPEALAEVPPAPEALAEVPPAPEALAEEPKVDEVNAPKRQKTISPGTSGF